MAKVLIVDDEPANRLLVTSLLRYAGYDVLEAANTADGFHTAQAQHPDLIIVDLFLPGSNGTQLIKQLRAQPDLQHTKLALYTGTRVDAMLDDFMRVFGVAYVIPKPSEPEDLLRIVGEALQS